MQSHAQQQLPHECLHRVDRCNCQAIIMGAGPDNRSIAIESTVLAPDVGETPEAGFTFLENKHRDFELAHQERGLQETAPRVRLQRWRLHLVQVFVWPQSRGSTNGLVDRLPMHVQVVLQAWPDQLETCNPAPCAKITFNCLVGAVHRANSRAAVVKKQLPSTRTGNLRTSPRPQSHWYPGTSPP